MWKRQDPTLCGGDFGASFCQYSSTKALVGYWSCRVGQGFMKFLAYLGAGVWGRGGSCKYKSYQYSTACYVPFTVLSNLHGLSHLFLRQAYRLVTIIAPIFK